MIGQAISHYSITEKLGEGGMGVVYRAHDQTLHRDVALKFLSVDAINDPMARTNILTEARTISALNHPNICTIYEVGEADGRPYLAMEFIEGHTLSLEITSVGMAVDIVVRYGMQLADALSHAHERGIVHRDLKAANVIITPSGRLKVLDFGLSRRLVLAEHQRGNHAVRQIVGRPAFDYWHARRTWRRNCCAARTPAQTATSGRSEFSSTKWLPDGGRFKGGSAFELSALILREAPPPIDPPLPPVLQSVIDKCLDKDPGQRYHSGGEVRAALEAAATASRSERIPVAALAVHETRAAFRATPETVVVERAQFSWR